jgi:hypothetical protein
VERAVSDSSREATVPLRKVSPGVYELETPRLTEPGIWTAEIDAVAMLGHVVMPHCGDEQIDTGTIAP